MSDYIERSVIERLLTIAAAGDGDKKRRTWARAICVLHDAPAADVAPVKWISAEKELPIDGQEVLCWYEYYRYGEYNRMFQTFGIGYQYNNGNWGGEVATGQKAKVLAWMPLPDAPKMDGGDERAAD